MAYGERGTSIDPATLKLVFKDAMRWQLDRIRQSQIGSTEAADAHLRSNRIYVEFWRQHAARGSDALWTDGDESRLIGEGWSSSEVTELMREVNRHGSRLVSLRQLQTYADQLGFELTPSNQKRVEQVVLSARAAACDRANHELGRGSGDLSAWAKEAIASTDPLIFEMAASDCPAPNTSEIVGAEFSPSVQSGSPAEAKPRSHNRKPEESTTSREKLLNTAKDECIAAYEKEQAWSRDSVEQVGTAIRLFDYVCGGNVTIEAITRDHVLEFKKLCDNLPNRWGRTREEKAGGIQASLERATKMDSSMLGMARITQNKHLTWIFSVLAFAASQAGGNHEPVDGAAVEKAIREVRRGLGKKGGKSDRQRARDKRAAWKQEEISRLLAAPIWIGCHDLDRRFEPGPHIYHDAWYWLPLMMVLYGGRSAEIVALPLADTHENEPIPFFRIDYTDLRSLKNVQSVRHLPVHPEIIRLGFIDYI